MSDVFISYARSTEEQAKRVEQALEARGYSVWRDDELPAHRTYADVIEERLKSAKAVVVAGPQSAGAINLRRKHLGSDRCHFHA